MTGKKKQDWLDEGRAAHSCGSVAVSLLKPGTKRYEKWRSLRNHRRKATMRKKQQEQVMGLNRTPLDSDLVEENTGNKADGKHCGVFIPLPYNLAKDFPGKRDEDDSMPHYTVLYVGDLSPKAYKVFCNLVRKCAQKFKTFDCDLSHYSEFLNPKGQKIAHMVPSIHCRSKLAILHGVLRRYIEAFGKNLGVSIKHTYGPMDTPKVPYEIKFKPHATLAYLPPMMPYKGAKPTGSWRVNEIECWGHENIRIPFGRTKADQPIGITRDPLAINYPMAVPDVVDEDKIPGGLADRSSPADFDAKSLRQGIKVEMEHTSDPKIAREIAMDHLKEDPRYYAKLSKIHSEDVIGGSMGAVGKGTGGSSGDIGMAGSLPAWEVMKDLEKKLRRKQLAGLA